MSLRMQIALAAAVLGLVSIGYRTAVASDTVIRPAVLTRVAGAPAPISTLQGPTSAVSGVRVTTVGWRRAYSRPYVYGYRPYVAYRPYVYAYPPYPYYNGGAYAPYGAYYGGPGVYGRYPGRYHW